jgi:hypothetical protein
MMFTFSLGSDCAEESQTDENLSPFVMDCETTSRIVEVKARKAFVPPLLKNADTQYTSAMKLRVEPTSTTASLKRSGYFSRPAPSQLHRRGPVIIPEDHHKKKTDEGSLWSTGTDTQNSEGIDLADHMECSNDVLNCPDVNKVLQICLLSYSCSNHQVLLMMCVCGLRQILRFVLRDKYDLNSDCTRAFQKRGILKDITNRGQPYGIAAGKSKYQHVSYTLVN